MLNYGPAVLILFSIFVGILLNRRDYSLLREDTNRRFAELKDDLNVRFKHIDTRFEQVDKRFEQMEKRFEQIDKRFEQMDKRLSLIEADQKQFFRTTGIIDGRIDEISARIK